MSNRPRTFILADSDRFNTSQLNEFGERHYLFKTRCSPFNVDDVIINIWKVLADKNFNSETDFIVLTGPMILVSVMLIAVTARYPKFKLLMFDASQSKYRERVIDTEAFMERACLNQKN